MTEPRWRHAHLRSSSLPRSAPWLRLLGGLPGGAGVCVVIGAAALGALVTAVTGKEPGLLLGVFLVTGTVAASLAVLPRAAYLIIPAPALAYVAAAVIAGVIHDRSADTSRTALALSATQWIASGFVAMTAATGAAFVIAVARWLWSRRRPRRRERARGGSEAPQPVRPASQSPAPAETSEGRRSFPNGPW